MQGKVAFPGLSNIGIATSTSYTNLCSTKAGGEVATSTLFVGCVGSSETIKHDIQPLTVDSVSIIKNLKPVSFIYNEDPTNTVTWGFIV